MAIHTANLPRIQQGTPAWQPALRPSPLPQRRGVVRATATPSRIARANAIALAKTNEVASDAHTRLRATGVFVVGFASAVTLIGLL
jgi:hypothetical protein